MVQMVSDQDSGGINLDLSKFSLRRGMDDMEVEEEEEVPKHLNTINSSGGFLVVSTDKLSVQYTSVNLHGHDVGVVQANCPAPVKRLVYYFEIFVKNAGAKGQIAIGFTNEHFKMRRQPGWEANSYGYHGDDGLLYRGQGKGETFGPTFTSGDTIGGGINYASQEFFFTKNGKLVGTVYKDVKGPLFPTIAVHSQNEEVNVNFGQQSFVFDVEAFVLEERMRQQMTIEKISLPRNISHWIIRSYFLHYGYQDTLNSFDLASRSTLPPIPVVQENGINERGNTYALRHRKILRQLIRSGELDSVFGKLRDWYPQIVQNESSTICFLLHCQKFIELVRVGNLEDAVTYARAELARFFGITSLASLLQDCIALLAYEEPMKSPVGHLLHMSQREVVADAVNAMVLSTNPNMKDSQSYLQSYLERLLRQLATSCLERRSLHGDQGETFQLNRVLQSRNGGKR
ncbi:ran-binding protein M homolog [Telopea speciosissima]|uniref:ran-binding protein M homolog n=1 Tax=Telopea speciosissima TaxID=54955 RepID=UPI001CC38902|nr:ran-binding protein M homolog [Telopea speciosissima]